MSEKLRTAAGEMPGRLRMAAGEMPEKIRSAAATAGEMPGRVRTVAGNVPEKLRMELAELKENAAKELQKILSRSDETHAGAMKQLRRNPTAASSRFKDVLEELKKYMEKDK